MTADGPTTWWPLDPAPVAPDAPRRAGILLDRDGTLNVEVDHLDDADELHPLPRAQAAVARAAAAGLAIAVVTNQSVIGRGLVSEEGMAGIHRRLHDFFPDIELVVHCPHLPDDGCPCRKPSPLMLQAAMALLGIDPARCAYVGDHLTDVQAAAAAGLPGYLVRTGHGGGHADPAADAGAMVVADLADAIDAHLAGLDR